MTGVSERGQVLLDLGVEVGDVRAELVDPGQHLGQQEPVVVGEVAHERFLQGRDGAYPGPGQLGQDLGVALPADHRSHHVPPGDPEDVTGRSPGGLQAQRWATVRAAREAGDSRTVLRAALGTSRQAVQPRFRRGSDAVFRKRGRALTPCDYLVRTVWRAARRISSSSITTAARSVSVASSSCVTERGCRSMTHSVPRLNPSWVTRGAPA